MSRLPPRLSRVARRLQRSQERRPRLYYYPSPALSGFMVDMSLRQCVLAANRVGKTQHAAKKLADIMIEHPGTRARCVGPSEKRVDKVHAAYLHHFLREHLDPSCTYRHGKGFTNNEITLRNGSSCELMNFRQDPDTHASSSLHIVWIDEPPPPWVLTEAESRVFDTARRLDHPHGGSVWVTLTAVGRPTKWLKESVQQGIKDRAAGDGDGWSFYQVALSRANCPWYSDEQIAERVRQVGRTPWEYKQRIEGSWDGVSEGRRFASYQDRNLLSLHTGPRQGWPSGNPVRLIWAVDHGEGAGHSVWILLGYQIVSRTRWGVTIAIRALGDYTNAIRQSAAEEVRQVGERLAELGFSWRHVSWAVGDTNTTAKSEAAKTLNELFEIEIAKAMGLPPYRPAVEFRRANKGPDSVRSQIAVANQLFGLQVAPGVQALSVSEECYHLNESLSHWAGKEDDLKHAADAFRYGIDAIVADVGGDIVDLAA